MQLLAHSFPISQNPQKCFHTVIFCRRFRSSQFSTTVIVSHTVFLPISDPSKRYQFFHSLFVLKPCSTCTLFVQKGLHCYEKFICCVIQIAARELQFPVYPRCGSTIFPTSIVEMLVLGFHIGERAVLSVSMLSSFTAMKELKRI